MLYLIGAALQLFAQLTIAAGVPLMFLIIAAVIDENKKGENK